MTTEQMDWLDDDRAGKHQTPPQSRTAYAEGGDADTLQAIDEDTIEAVASAIGLSARIVPGRPWSAFDVEDQDQHRSEATAAIEALMKRGWTP